MKLLLQRGEDWYLGNRRVIGGDLGGCWLGPEDEWLRSVDGDRLIVCESYVEALDGLRGVFCSLIRLWDQYSWGRGMWMYMGSGWRDVSGMRGYEGFIGEWPGEKWSVVRREILEICDREYVIKRSWLEKLRVGLKESEKSFF